MAINKMLIIGGVAAGVVIIASAAGGAIFAANISSNNSVSTPQIEEKVKLNGWQEKNGDWYYYKDDTTQTGWIEDKNNRYYLDDSGKMSLNWVQDKNKWYYLGSNGKMRTGWIQDQNKWYYLNSDGTMASSTTIDGYYLNEKGLVQEKPNNNISSGDLDYPSGNLKHPAADLKHPYEYCLVLAQEYFENSHGYKYTIKSDTMLNDRDEYTFLFYQNESGKLVDGCYANFKKKYVHKMPDLSSSEAWINIKAISEKIKGTWKLNSTNIPLTITDTMFGKYTYTIVDEGSSIHIDVNETSGIKRYDISVYKNNITICVPDSKYIDGYTVISRGTRISV